MPDSVSQPNPVYDQWQQELRSLLIKIGQHPSADLDSERDRVAVLNALIAKRAGGTHDA
ncbi:hypothetical protein [Sphingomonas sp.]|uniref:hypothetical protein n=1 Tax=Sphingomonas sp. TaxID=28214 RepID=UPI0025DD23AB|nr:hypothetical protein [Sphingomonas sp.]